MEQKFMDFLRFENDPYCALQFILDVFLQDIYPYMNGLAQKLRKNKEFITEATEKSRNVFILCSDQLRKCFMNFIEVIRLEHAEQICFQHSRQCILERISWCFHKLNIINEQLYKKSVENDEKDCSDESLLLDSMYFVNWIDQTFEILNKLSSLVYEVNCDDPVKQTKRRDELVECVCGLHTSIDELLLSAMTLCKYCLASDQVVVKARCQVVLRETKALLNDLIVGDVNCVFRATVETLKLPINPLNVNVLIDVLKDVLYALETNTNTALLALLVYSFSQNISPAEMLKNHLSNSESECHNVNNLGGDIEDKCEFVQFFDTYSERLWQIGTFAMSCSCDERRILGLRSGLASLEALDPHLVPALMIAPTSHHSTVLLNIWNQEVGQIRDNVFLIVDPAAFIDKIKQMMHQRLLEIMNVERYDNMKSCEVINVGCLVHEFFDVYNRHEPDALPQNENLQVLLKDLHKVQEECKFVSDNLCSGDDFVYDARKNFTAVTQDKLVKRLKLLYTIVKRIYFIFNPKDNDDEFYNEAEGDKQNTYTINVKAQKTYVNSLKNINITKSIFARSNNARVTPAKFPLAILTKHLKKTDLSFSVKLDELCNLSEIKKDREQSILYPPNMKKQSLRKAVLSKHLIPGKIEMKKGILEDSGNKEKDSFMDETMNLQITDVLNQLNNLTNSVSTNVRRPFHSTTTKSKDAAIPHRSAFDVDTCDVSVDSDRVDTSQPSDVNTLERINDLDLVESKLSNLKFGHTETTL